MITNKSTAATDEDERPAHGTLQFCPISASSNQIIAGTRVVTSFGVGVVERAEGTKVVVTMPWGIVYTFENKLDFNVVPALLRNADRMREMADELVLEKSYKQAAACYERAFRTIPRSQHQVAPQSMSLLCSMLSWCYIRTEIYDKALMWSESALKFDSKNYKAIFRQGVAHSRLGNYAEADSLFRKVSKQLVGADAEAVRREMKSNKERLDKKKQRGTDKRPFSQFFCASPRGGVEFEEGPQHKIVRKTDGEEVDLFVREQTFSFGAGISGWGAIMTTVGVVLTLGAVAVGFVIGRRFSVK